MYSSADYGELEIWSLSWLNKSDHSTFKYKVTKLLIKVYTGL